MSQRFLAVVLAVCLGACARPYFTGQLNLERVERGETFVESIVQPGNRVMLRVVTAVDAPPWRVLNVARDVEAAPLWHAGLAQARILSSQGDDIEAEYTYEPLAWHRLGPLSEHIHIDAERNEVSITVLETDWLREGQMVTRLEPLGDGSRTLVTLYSFGVVKRQESELLRFWAEDRFARTAHNIGRVAQLPKYAQRRTDAVEARMTKVAVPGFTAEGVPEDLARTITRVFAEELTKQGGWEISTPQEVAAELNYNRKQTLLGCDASTGCAIDLGRALGADYLVAGSIGRLGDKFVLSASLVKIPDGNVERRSSRGGAENQLLGAVHALAFDLRHP